MVKQLHVVVREERRESGGQTSKVQRKPVLLVAHRDDLAVFDKKAQFDHNLMKVTPPID